jgi:O-antigen/teichoic acid export membrane protein
LVLGARGVVLRIVAFGGFLVLARQLSPSDFGVLAFGLSISAVGGIIASSGIGPALIRRQSDPQADELRAVMGVQVLAALAFAGAIAAIAILHGGEMLTVGAIMSLSLPLETLKVACLVETERRIQYEPIALAQIAETISFFGLAITAVEIGFGTTAIAFAAVAKSATGAALLLLLVPAGRLMPRPDFRAVRPFVSFGLAVQGVSLVSLVRDQGINLGIAALAGPATLGLWSLGFRMMQIPALVFEALWKVSYPTFARLSDIDDDAVPPVRAIAATVSLLTALIVVPLVCLAPLLVALVGKEWNPATQVVIWASLGLLVSGPVSVAGAGFLYSRGRASAVLSAVALGAAAWMATAMALVGSLGVEGVAIGWAVGALTEAVVLNQSVRSLLGLGMVRSTLTSFGSACVSGTLGLFASEALGHGVSGALLGTVSAFTALAAATWLMQRDLMRGLLRRLVALRRSSNLGAVSGHEFA